MSSEKRPYALKARGDRQTETRRRIVEATAALHREVGPARTTIAEIARRAGVQRLTVYAHFPDEIQLITACQEHFYDVLPPPDLTEAMSQPLPADRLRSTLTALYGWYQQAEDGFTPVLRDRGAVPALDTVLERVVDAPQAELAATLAAGFGLTGTPGDSLRAMIRLALDFWTWRRLKSEGFDPSQAAGVWTVAITGLASGSATAS